MPYFFPQLEKMSQNLLSAAVVIGALRVKIRNNRVFYVKPGPKVIKLFFILDSNEHEISTDHRDLNTERKKTFLAFTLRYCIYHANKS